MASASGSGSVFSLTVKLNVVGMLILVCAPTPCLSEEVVDITRDYHGDLFTVPPTDCQRSGCNRRGSFAAPVPGHDCKCQCSPSYQVFREDLMECVNNITDCPLAAFVRPYITEQIPVVSLPTAGQLVHPGAHLTIAEVSTGFGPLYLSCQVYSSEVMTAHGWHPIDGDKNVFELIDDRNKTFLQWLGNDVVRRQLQQRLVLVRLECTSFNDDSGDYYRPCAAMRIGWVPGASLSRGTHSMSHPRNMGKGGGNQNYLIIGLSLGILGLMYVMALMIYLRTRKSQLRKRSNSSVSKSSSPQTQTSSMERGESGEGEADFSDGGLSADSLKDAPKQLHCHFNPAMIDDEGNKRYSSNKYSSTSNSQNSQRPSNKDQETISFNPSAEPKATGSDSSGGTPGGPVPERVSKRTLQINPALLDPAMLAEPPPPALEFLKRIRDMISSARNRIKNFRFKPTLLVIPEDDYFYQDLQLPKNKLLESGSENGLRGPPVPPPRVSRGRRTVSTPMVGRRDSALDYMGTQVACLVEDELFDDSDLSDFSITDFGPTSTIELIREEVPQNKKCSDNSKANKVNIESKPVAGDVCYSTKSINSLVPEGNGSPEAMSPADAPKKCEKVDLQKPHESHSKISRKQIMMRLDEETVHEMDTNDDGCLLDNDNEAVGGDRVSPESKSPPHDVRQQEVNNEPDEPDKAQASSETTSSLELNQESDQKLNPANFQEEPSAETIIRLSNKVAKKLSERKALSGEMVSDSQEQEEKDGKHILQLMKDFKNSIGRMGNKQPKPSISAFDGSNWKLQTASSGSTAAANGSPPNQMNGKTNPCFEDEANTHPSDNLTSGDESDSKNGTSVRSKSSASGHYTRNNKLSEKHHNKYQKSASIKSSKRAQKCPKHSHKSNKAHGNEQTNGYISDQGTSTDAWSISSGEVSTTSSTNYKRGHMSSLETTSIDSDMTDDSLETDQCNCDEYESTIDFTDDEDNAIEACLTQLANATIESDCEAVFKIDRATKGLATLQKIKATGYKHYCQEHRRRREGHKKSRKEYSSDDNASTSASTVTASSFKFSDGLNSVPPPAINYASHPSRMTAYNGHTDILRSDDAPKISVSKIPSMVGINGKNRQKSAKRASTSRSSSGVSDKPEDEDRVVIARPQIMSGDESSCLWTSDGEVSDCNQLQRTVHKNARKHLNGNCKRFIQRKAGEQSISEHMDNNVRTNGAASRGPSPGNVEKEVKVKHSNSTIIEVTGTKPSPHFITRIPV